MVAKVEDAEPVELNISPAKVCDIISKARMFDVKVEPGELEPDAISAEDQDALEDYPGDPSAAELREVINDLNDDEVVDLIALAWVGRGDYSREEWEEAQALALERHRQHSANYLMGMPTLSDYLEEGLTALGYSCEA